MDALENYFHLLDEQDKELIITGDLNFDLSLSVLQHQPLIDILELFQMKRLIVDPTRTTGNTESLIDIIETNRKQQAYFLMDPMDLMDSMDLFWNDRL